MIIDATDLIIGRIGTFVAKKALQGEKFDIVNCEKAVVTGKKSSVLAKYKQLKDRGTYKGPFLPKQPNLFVRRVIRGMIPYRRERGREAFKGIKCYTGVPEELKDKKMETIKEASVSKLPTLNYVSVREICKSVGAKIE